MITKVLRLAMLACILMNIELADAKGRSSGGSRSSRSSSSSRSSRTTTTTTRRSYYGGGGSYSSFSFSRYVPINYYTNSAGVVVVVDGSMGYGQYYYDARYSYTTVNPNYNHTPPGNGGGFFVLCCICCFICCFMCCANN